MSETAGPITGSVAAIAAALVFVILFIALRRVVAQMPLFSGVPHTLVAFCVAALAVLGMAPGASHAILVPYGALGLAILLLMLLGLRRAWGASDRGCGKDDQDSRELRKSDDRKA